MIIGTVIKKKVCLLGAFGVGKTSLVRKFAHSVFDERYLSTIGVRIDRKTLAVDDEEILLLIWDVAGEEEFAKIPASYIAGASGCLFVADGTRPETLTTLEGIRQRVIGQLGADLPSVILLNKSDLKTEWHLEEADQAALESGGTPCFLTSAKVGEGVEEAFSQLAEQLLARARGR